TCSGSASTKIPSGIAPITCAASSMYSQPGRLPEITATVSPRRRPRLASPRATARTWAAYCPHVTSRQMPYFFSRSATRSARAPGNVAWSGAGARARASLHRLQHLAQVGLDHRGILLHLGGRALGDLLPEVEHDHPVRDVHHHAHVVLDHHHREVLHLPDV